MVGRPLTLRTIAQLETVLQLCKTVPSVQLKESAQAAIRRLVFPETPFIKRQGTAPDYDRASNPPIPSVRTGSGGGHAGARPAAVTPRLNLADGVVLAGRLGSVHTAAAYAAAPSLEFHDILRFLRIAQSFGVTDAPAIQPALAAVTHSVQTCEIRQLTTVIFLCAPLAHIDGATVLVAEATRRLEGALSDVSSPQLANLLLDTARRADPTEGLWDAIAQELQRRAAFESPEILVDYMHAACGLPPPSRIRSDDILESSGSFDEDETDSTTLDDIGANATSQTAVMREFEHAGAAQYCNGTRGSVMANALSSRMAECAARFSTPELRTLLDICKNVGTLPPLALTSEYEHRTASVIPHAASTGAADGESDSFEFAGASGDASMSVDPQRLYRLFVAFDCEGVANTVARSAWPALAARRLDAVSTMSPKQILHLLARAEALCTKKAAQVDHADASLRDSHAPDDSGTPDIAATAAMKRAQVAALWDKELSQRVCDRVSVFLTETAKATDDASGTPGTNDSSDVLDLQQVLGLAHVLHRVVGPGRHLAGDDDAASSDKTKPREGDDPSEDDSSLAGLDVGVHGIDEAPVAVRRSSAWHSMREQCYAPLSAQCQAHLVRITSMTTALGAGGAALLAKFTVAAVTAAPKDTLTGALVQALQKQIPFVLKTDLLTSGVDLKNTPKSGEDDQDGKDEKGASGSAPPAQPHVIVPLTTQQRAFLFTVVQVPQHTAAITSAVLAARPSVFVELAAHEKYLTRYLNALRQTARRSVRRPTEDFAAKPLLPKQCLALITATAMSSEPAMVDGERQAFLRLHAVDYTIRKTSPAAASSPSSPAGGAGGASSLPTCRAVTISALTKALQTSQSKWFDVLPPGAIVRCVDACIRGRVKERETAEALLVGLRAVRNGCSPLLLARAAVGCAQLGAKDPEAFADISTSAVERAKGHDTASTVVSALYCTALANAKSSQLTAQCVPRLRIVAPHLAARDIALLCFAMWKLRVPLYATVRAAIVQRTADVTEDFTPSALTTVLAHLRLLEPNAFELRAALVRVPQYLAAREDTLRAAPAVAAQLLGAVQAIESDGGLAVNAPSAIPPQTATTLLYTALGVTTEGGAALDFRHGKGAENTQPRASKGKASLGGTSTEAVSEAGMQFPAATAVDAATGTLVTLLSICGDGEQQAHIHRSTASALQRELASLSATPTNASQRLQHRAGVDASTTKLDGGDLAQLIEDKRGLLAAHHAMAPMYVDWCIGRGCVALCADVLVHRRDRLTTAALVDASCALARLGYAFPPPTKGAIHPLLQRLDDTTARWSKEANAVRLRDAGVLQMLADAQAVAVKDRVEVARAQRQGHHGQASPHPSGEKEKGSAAGEATARANGDSSTAGAQRAVQATAAARGLSGVIKGHSVKVQSKASAASGGEAKKSAKKKVASGNTKLKGAKAVTVKLAAKKAAARKR